MSLFDENRLKDEELFGGFAEADNETFAKGNVSMRESEVTVQDDLKDASVTSATESETIKEEKKEAAEQPKPEPEQKKTEPPKKVKVIKPTVHKIEKEQKKKSHGAIAWFSAIAVLLILLFALAYWLTTIGTRDFFLEHSLVEDGSTYIPMTVSPETQEQDKTSEEITADDFIEEIEPEFPETEIIEIEKEPAKTKIGKITKPKVIKPAREPIVIEKEITTEREKVSTNTSNTKTKTKEPVKEQKKEKIVLTPKPEKEITASKITMTEKKSKKIETLKPAIEEQTPRGLFTIEVYSSYSYEDAKIWQDKLNRRNLNASIVTQRIKGKVLYKVRFGSFPTEIDARRMAMKLGLSRSHIDRIK